MRTGRKDKPVDRVRFAMVRLSRDRWLSGDEVNSISRKLADCCSSNPTWTAERSVSGECRVVGMLRGFPPAWHWDSDYGQFVDALYRRKPKNPELVILKLIIERNRHGSRPRNLVR